MCTSRSISAINTDDNIVEFQSANFHNGTAPFLEIMLVLDWPLRVAGCPREYAEVLLLAVWAHGALIAARNIPIFMIIAAPMVATALAAWSKSLYEMRESARISAWISGLAGCLKRPPRDPSAGADRTRALRIGGSGSRDWDGISSASAGVMLKGNTTHRYRKRRWRCCNPRSGVHK